MDMDSTLIQCECIDEIADFMGIKAKISAITERAMRGELDFSASLIERVQLLAGLNESVLHTVYQDRIVLTDGAETLIEVLHQVGWKVGLVSGGFNFFTQRLQKRLGLDFARANHLEINQGTLTGKIIGDIVDADCKQQCLQKQALLHGIPLQQTIAVGDGANDLPMLKAAGLGIAFHAKPAVQAEADYTIETGGLDQIITLLR